MYDDHNDTIHAIFRSSGLLAPEQLADLTDRHRSSGRPLASVAIDSGLIARDALLRAAADFLGCAYAADVPVRVQSEAVGILEPAVARMYGVVPLSTDASAVELLAVDPFNAAVVDDLSFSLGKDVRVVVADPDAVASLLAETYGVEDVPIDEALGEIGEAFQERAEPLDEAELSDLAQQTPIIRFVNLVLQQAIRDEASDIHFEPYEDRFRIRYRIDGALYEMAPPPRSLSMPVISRIKVLANLNISETRVPQDGRIKMTVAGRPVDLRVSTLPTRFGESVVLRVLDKSVVNLDLDQLSLPEDMLGRIRALVERPNGIFIVTGPTGSGKTTTLYSALREANKVGTKILTAEDPVEYEIDGIMQVAVNHQVGLDFARALRAFLRQDPDKIMVGEIRDLETAQIAVQASLTGHVVLSTLHTNDAAGAVTRLIDMGLEPFLISASLEAVLAQRLVRRICRDCRTSYDPDPEVLDLLQADPSEIAGREFFYGTGCASCGRTGYRGRTGLFEMLIVTDAIRELINERAATLSIRKKALEQGMQSLYSAGLRAIFDGSTTIDEVLKYT